MLLIRVYLLLLRSSCRCLIRSNVSAAIRARDARRRRLSTTLFSGLRHSFKVMFLSFFFLVKLTLKM